MKLKSSHVSPVQPLPPKQAGFTIIELLIATSIFAVILLVVTAGILQFSRQYYKGVISSSTQNAARTLIDDVTRAMQFSGGGFAELTPSPASGGSSGYCLGASKRYSYTLNRQVSGSPAAGVNQQAHGLVSDNLTGCSGATPALSVNTLPQNLSGLPLNNPRELLGANMRLAKFNIVANPAGDHTVTVRVVYGDNDLLCSPTTGDCGTPGSTAQRTAIEPDLTCRSGIGSQFCACRNYQQL